MRRITLVCVSTAAYTGALTNEEILAQNAKTREAALSKHPTARPDNPYAKKQGVIHGHCAEYVVSIESSSRSHERVVYGRS